MNHDRTVEDEKSNDGSGTEMTIINVQNQDRAILSEVASRIDLRRLLPSEQS